MEVKIGVQQAARELVVETEESSESVEKLITDALDGGKVLALTDTKGRKVIVPTDKLAYVELGPTKTGKVGFAG
ncbi:uncharacterized protein DUF3107 [Nocardioides albertanoniae]|uniref:Uncharacterized protein DUF3107 n=1 Tax=Nocardioides albertanoniae TaxID=1175486 RepID=A0A543A4E6_9ACTN|nr:DUF3107 domain-containing protein [Nocardioides albertanoniae]TQL67336.1 uncharacterized protein DUF3107 [Nocardioides albertanoniae]